MSKGGGFERNITKKLSKWWSNGKRDDIFWRTSSSGGRATQRMKAGCTTENSAGDACYLDAIGKPLIDLLCIEMKRGYTSTGRMTTEKKDKIRTVFKNFYSMSRNLKKKKAPAQYIENSLKQIVKVHQGTKKAGGIDVLDIIDGKMIKPLLINFWEKAEEDKKRSKRHFTWLIFHRDLKKDSLLFSSQFMTMFVAYCGEYKEKVITIDLPEHEDKIHVVELDKFLKYFRPIDVKNILSHETGKKKLVRKLTRRKKVTKRKIKRRDKGYIPSYYEGK